MNILFIHPNFPAQFWHLSSALARMGGNKVWFLTTKTNGNKIGGVTTVLYKRAREITKGIHPWLEPVEEAIIDGSSVANALEQLRDNYQYKPDVIVAHTGWGSTLFCKDVYPDVPVVGYFEWYYNAIGGDAAYFPGEKMTLDGSMRLRTRDSFHLMNLAACDVRFTPTEWQKHQFPENYQKGMVVVHEGVDTEFCRPQPGRKLVLEKTDNREALDLSDCPEILTYVSRGLEPYRGYPQFITAVGMLLKRRPKLHVVIVGTDTTCYGVKPDGGKTWKQVMDEKVEYDKSRVHFVGHLNRPDYQTVMQASTVHVYYTRPFILSWSCIEAMSFGCAMVGSKTPPVEEVMVDGENGLLANFRSPEHLAMRVEELLDNPELRARLGKAARQTVLERFDMRDCIKKQIDMIFGAIQ
jgi:glycosyltransferase involved in cell wall biosynthesis